MSKLCVHRFAYIVAKACAMHQAKKIKLKTCLTMQLEQAIKFVFAGLFGIYVEVFF